MKILAIFLLAGTAWGQPTVTWTQQTVPSAHGAWVAWNKLRYDALSGQHLVLSGTDATLGPTGIYAGTMWALTTSAGASAWTNIVTTGSLVDQCTADANSLPGDRHPGAQFALDTKRELLFMWGGVNQPCSAYHGDVSGSTVTRSTGTNPYVTGGNWNGVQIQILNTACTAIAPCSISSVSSGTSMTLTTSPGNVTNQQITFQDPGNQGTRDDMYYMSVNSSPASNTWTRMTTVTARLGGDATNAAVYDSGDDAILQISHGGADQIIMTRFCSTISNPTPGTLTATQSSNGCTAADAATNDSTFASGSGPPGNTLSGLAYSPATGLIYLYGGQNGNRSTTFNQTWAYNPGASIRGGIAAHSWAQKCGGGCTAPNVEIGNSTALDTSFEYNSNRLTFIHHQSSGTGSPADYEYNPASDTWTLLTSSGGGPTGFTGSTYNGVDISYDPVNNRLVSHSYGPQVWVGQLSGTTLSAPLTIQETLYPGSTSGVNRTNEPFCMGVPISNSASITATTNLTLTGISTAQFRILGTWPSGHVKYVKACGIVPTLSAGSTVSTTLSNGGSANTSCGTTTLPNGSDTTCTGYGGANLATDNGTTITVSTNGGSCGSGSAICFTVKKANFNVIDVMQIGSTSILSTSASQTRGLVLTGPSPTATFPGNVTCSPDTGGSTCNVIYSSANDSASTCVIEENGPAVAVLKCTGTHYDNASHPYMHFTARETFYSGKSSVKVQVVLRNADYDTAHTPSNDCQPGGSINTCQGSTSFNLAAKGLKAYELRVAPAISSTLNYVLSTSGADQTGTLNGSSDTAFIYTAQTFNMSANTVDGSYCDPSTSCANAFTTDTGYTVKKNSTVLASGGTGAAGAPVAVGGYADISNASGVGVEIGIYQMSAYWPASLEFQTGGSDARIGIYSAQNSKNIYLNSFAWDVHEVWLNFHTSALSSPANEFLKFQHFLVVRPSFTYTNATAVMPQYPIPDPSQEDAYYVATATQSNPAVPQHKFCYSPTNADTSTTNCTPDRGTNDSSAFGLGMGLGVPRYYPWGTGGSLNQLEARWGDMLRFLQRGQTGRFLNSKHFYQYMIGWHYPHADGTNVNGTDATINGFTWRSRPPANIRNSQPTAVPELDSYGQPSIAAVQNKSISLTGQYWLDPAHDHIDGVWIYYFLTGDELIKEAVVPKKDFYLNTQTYQYGGAGVGGNLSFVRAWGVTLRTTANYSEYLASIADTDATNVLAIATSNFDSFINTQTCYAAKLPGGSTANFPTGCTPPPVGNYGNDPIGTAFERGMMFAARGQAWCSAPDGHQSGLTGYYRNFQPFQHAILEEGVLNLRRVKGTTWTEYNRALDMAMGEQQAVFAEAFLDNGSSKWLDGQISNGGQYVGKGFDNGFAYNETVDMQAVCPPGTTLDSTLFSFPDGHIYDPESISIGAQNMFQNFYTRILTTGPTSLTDRQFKIALQQTSQGTSAWPGDFGMQYTNQIIYSLNNPPSNTIQDVSFTLSSLGGGNYQLTFTPPSATCTNDPSCLRVKWSTKIIQTDLTQLLQFNNLYTDQFGIDPTTTQPWFSSNNVWPEPTPTPGVQQTFTVATGTTGLTTSNFSVKSVSQSTATVTPTSLPNTTINVNYGSHTLTASNFTGTVTWSLLSGTPPAGLGGTCISGGSGPTCTISGTPTAAATYNFSIRATDGTSIVDTPYTVIIYPVPVITTSSLPSGVQGTAYSYTMTETGGTPPLTWSITSGTLQNGLSFSSSGVISGTPTVSSTVPLTFHLVDSVNVAATDLSTSLTINTPPSTTLSGPIIR